MEIGNTYIIVTTNDDGDNIKLPAEYLGVNKEDVNCFRINGIVMALDDEEYYIYDSNDDMTVSKLISLLEKFPKDKLISIEMDGGTIEENGINLVSKIGTNIDIIQAGDVVTLSPNNVYVQEY